MIKQMVGVMLVAFVLSFVVPNTVSVVDGACVDGVRVCSVALDTHLQNGILDQSLDSKAIHLDVADIDREIGLQDISLKDLALDNLHGGLSIQDADGLRDLDGLTARLELSTLSDIDEL